MEAVMQAQQHEAAPSRLVHNARFQDAFTDQLERQNRLEERQSVWLASFLSRHPEARVR